MEKRNTIQKELVLGAVRSMKSHVTADEVYLYLNKEYPNLAKGTVYRNLNSLAEDGEILKIEIPDGSDRFDFNTHKHYHVRCIRCDKVADVDMDAFDDMESRIKDTHGMQFLDYDILFKGICSDCNRN